MEQTPLVAQKRTILGKKVKQLRREGILPAHVFGHKVETDHVQVNAHDFAKVFEKVGETGIIALTIDGVKKPVMVRDTQLNPITDDLVHIDFYQVNLSEKVKVNVPIEIIGESPAVEKKIGLLLTPITEVEVEALPGDLPENIEVDITNLLNIDDEIKVKDLKVDRSKIEVLTDEELVVAQIGELVTKEMEELEAEVEAEQAEAVAVEAPAEGAEGAAEGEASAEGAETSEKPQEEKSE
ncbi:MAG: 50S ribosomal protein L25 [Patescibacteria group bacterium]